MRYLSYKQMCQTEGKGQITRGIYFQKDKDYSLIFMSRRKSATYKDRLMKSDFLVEYSGSNFKGQADKDQRERNAAGKLTANGMLKEAARKYINGEANPRKVKIYEKVKCGLWLYRGVFLLVMYRYIEEGGRKVFKFYFKPEEGKAQAPKPKRRENAGAISAEVKQEVYNRDGGSCAICGSKEELSFDHIIPISKGGAFNSVSNLQLLCMKHNLQKSAEIR